MEMGLQSIIPCIGRIEENGSRRKLMNTPLSSMVLIIYALPNRVSTLWTALQSIKAIMYGDLWGSLLRIEEEFGSRINPWKMDLTFICPVYFAPLCEILNGTSGFTF
jgi:hypothetical protein